MLHLWPSVKLCSCAGASYVDQVAKAICCHAASTASPLRRFPLQASWSLLCDCRPLHFKLHRMQNTQMPLDALRLSLTKQMADLQHNLCSQEEAFIAIQKLAACQLEQDNSGKLTLTSSSYETLAFLRVHVERAGQFRPSPCSAPWSTTEIGLTSVVLLQIQSQFKQLQPRHSIPSCT